MRTGLQSCNEKTQYEGIPYPSSSLGREVNESVRVLTICVPEHSFIYLFNDALSVYIRENCPGRES
jgi:transposase-like protein